MRCYTIYKITLLLHLILAVTTVRCYDQQYHGTHLYQAMELAYHFKNEKGYARVVDIPCDTSQWSCYYSHWDGYSRCNWSEGSSPATSSRYYKDCGVFEY